MYLMGRPDSFGIIQWKLLSGSTLADVFGLFYVCISHQCVGVPCYTEPRGVTVTPVQCLCPWRPGKGGVGMLLAVLKKGVKSHSLGMRWL